MLDGFRTRNPWAAAIVGLVFGPIVGMLYLNKGKVAFYYLIAVLVLVSLPFIAAHYEILTSDPRKVATLSSALLQIIGFFHCFSVAKKWKGEELKWYAHWYAIILLCFVLPLTFAVMQRHYFYEPFYVGSKSMEPTLYPEDYFLVDKRAYGATNLPQRGDVIVFKVRTENATAAYIKRIIGMPGDKVQLKGGVINLNDAPLQQRAIQANEDSSVKFAELLPEGKEITILEGRDDIAKDTPLNEVPSGQYFVVGDYRSQSHDSRNGLGYISQEDIMGKALAIFWNTKTYKFSYKPVE